LPKPVAFTAAVLSNTSRGELDDRRNTKQHSCEAAQLQSSSVPLVVLRRSSSSPLLLSGVSAPMNQSQLHVDAPIVSYLSQAINKTASSVVPAVTDTSAADVACAKPTKSIISTQLGLTQVCEMVERKKRGALLWFVCCALAPLYVHLLQALLEPIPFSAIVQPVEVLGQQTYTKQATAAGAVPAMLTTTQTQLFRTAFALGAAGAALFRPAKGSHHPATCADVDDVDYNLAKLTKGSISSQQGRVQVCVIIQ
jgi:hypothetical protein